MQKFILKRMVLTIPSFFLIILAIFLMVSNLPGVQQPLSCFGSGDSLDQFWEKIHAPDNTMTQFIRQIYDMVTCQDPDSASHGIYTDLTYRIGNTLRISVFAFLFAILLGIPLGIIAALQHNRWYDHIISSCINLTASIPPFCLSLLLVLLFSVCLGILPPFGIDSWKGYVIPSIVLGISGTAMAMRMTRAEILGILSQPYITTLHAKGLSRINIVLVHVLKNALVPVISVLNNTLVHIICNTLIVENFFSIRGIGTYLLSAVFGRNHQKLLSCAAVLAAIILFVNLLTDILYALVNPYINTDQYRRTRRGGGKK